MPLWKQPNRFRSCLPKNLNPSRTWSTPHGKDSVRHGSNGRHDGVDRHLALWQNPATSGRSDEQAKVKRRFSCRGSRRRNFPRGAFKCVSLETLAEFYKSFHLGPLNQATMNAYCRLWVEMARAGHAADYPDLWIAACAVARKIPVLTRNPKHFTNVPALKVVGYEIV